MPDTRQPSQRWQATPPGDGPPPPPRHAAPTGHAGQGDSVRSPHPHTRAHSTWVVDPNGPPSRRAVGGGGAPELRRPSQRWKAPFLGKPFRHPHREQRRPTRAHAVGPVLGLHARTNRIRDTRVVEPRLPAPEDGWLGGGQRLTPDAPHNGGRPPPPGTAPHHPHGMQPPQGMQAKGTVLGPHTHTPAPTARGWRTPTARPVAGQSGEGERLTSDAPHNGGRHPPWGNPSATPTGSNAGPQGRTILGLVLGPQVRTNRIRDTRVVKPRLPAPEDGRLGEGQRLTPDAPHNGGRPAPPGTAPCHPRGTQPPQGMQAKGTVLGPHTHTPAPTACGSRTPTARPVGGQFGEGERLTTDAPHNSGRHPPEDVLPPPPRRATLARKGARCGAGAGSPRPHRPHPGHTGCGTPAARPRGRAAGGGTAPDTRRPSQRWHASPPGEGPPPFPRHAAPTGHAGQGDSVGPPHPHTRAHSTWVVDRVAEPRLPAPEDGRPGEGQRLTPDAPHNGGRPPPQGTAPHHPRGTQPPQGMQAKGTVLGPHTHTPAPTACGWRTPTARPVGGQFEEEERLASDAPHHGGRHPPWERPSVTPTGSNAGPQGRTLWGRCWVSTPAPTAPGTHGSRSPGCPPQRTGGRGRDSA